MVQLTTAQKPLIGGFLSRKIYGHQECSDNCPR